MFSFLMLAMEESLPTDLKFESAVAALEKIVREMETGELPLEESIAAYQRGISLLRHCQSQLADAEQQLRILGENTSSDAGSQEET